MDTRIRVSIIAITLILAGIVASGLSARRITPIPPEDYTAYASGWLAANEDLNPYLYSDAVSSADRAGIALPEQFSLVYPPPFLLLMEPLRFLSPLVYSKVWLIILLLVGWVALFLCSGVIQEEKKRFLFIVLSILLLSFTGPMISAIRWGQISPFLLLALGIALFTGVNSRLSSVILSVFLLTKIGLAVVIIALSNRKAWTMLIVVLLSLSLLSTILYGFDIWGDYFEWLSKASSEWTLSRSNNLSIFAITSRLSQNWLMGAVTTFTRTERITQAGHASLIGKVLGIVSVNTVLLFTILITNRWKFRGVLKILSKLDRTVLIAWLAWFTIGACPIVYDHYGLLLIPLVAVSFARLSVLNAIIMYIFASIWCLLPPSSQGIGIIHSILCFGGALVFAIMYSRRQLLAHNKYNAFGEMTSK